MNETIRVTPDGYLAFGDSKRFYSLDTLQQAVLRAQNPTLNINTSGPPIQIISYKPVASNKASKTSNCSCQQEPLPLPTTLARNAEESTDDDDSFDDPYDQGHLPLPSTNRMVHQTAKAQQPIAINRDDEQHLPLPSTFRKTKS